MVEVKLLGPLEVAIDGRLVELTRKKERSLLALLALRPRQVVSTDLLVDGLWGESPPKAAVGSLQNLVSALRKTLGPEALETRSPGYLLDVEPERIDTHRFQRLVDDAAGSVNPEARAAKLREALELWRGPALADFSYDSFAQAEIVRLDEARLRAREALIEAELELGRHSDLIGELESIAAEHPLRERTNALLMLALYRADRQADALEVYRRTRAALVEQLGIDPSPALRELESAILRQDRALDVTVDPAGRRPSRASNLPVLPNELIGRDREVEEVRALLGQERVVTLIGPGGIGKTRLAHEVASRESSRFEAAFFVPLAGIDDVEFVEPALVQAVGADEPLPEWLRGRRVLLFIDNFEHVVGAAPYIAELLRALDGVTVLVTSRVPLLISGEQHYIVGQLSESDAMTLFAERAAAVAPDFEQEDHVVLQIVRRLEGLPLAVELAAARIRMLSQNELLERLTNDFSLLTGGPRDAPEHQRTLKASIEWSYMLLEDHEQRMLASLAVFAGGFSLDAAERICGADVQTLGALVDSSVVKSEGGRYRMLESIREYALEKIGPAADADALQQLHCEYFVALVEQAQGDLLAYGDRVRNVLRAENENLRAALDWSCRRGLPDLALRLSTGLFRYWVNESQLAEARNWLETSLAIPSPPDALTVRALGMLGDVLGMQGDFEQAGKLARRQHALASRLGDDVGVAESLLSLGEVAEQHGRFEQAVAYYEEALRLTYSFADEQGRRRVLSVAWLNLGKLASRLGDYERAHALLMECLSMNRELGREAAVGWSLEALGVAALEGNRASEALPLLTEALSLGIDREMARLVAWGLEALGAAYAAAEQPERAARTLGAADVALEAMGEPLDPYDRQQRDHAIELITLRIGRARFQSAWEEGRNLPPEAFLHPDGVSKVRPLAGDGVAAY